MGNIVARLALVVWGREGRDRDRGGVYNEAGVGVSVEDG